MPFDPAHAHLLLNHFPVIGSVLAVLMLALALMLKKDESTRAALLLTLFVGVVGVLVYLTGEPAEERVEHVAGIAESRIELHEEIALVATILSAVAGMAALAALLSFRRGVMPFTASAFVFVLALASAGVLGFTAWRGGQIRHSEIRGSALVDRGMLPSSAAAAPDHEEDDDD